MMFSSGVNLFQFTVFNLGYDLSLLGQVDHIARFFYYILTFTLVDLEVTVMQEKGRWVLDIFKK